MTIQFLQDMFTRLGGRVGPLPHQDERGGPCSGALSQAVEHVVDEVSSRLRAIPGYSRFLMGPVTTCFRYIDEMVEGVPGTLTCSRSAFNEDPRVNAFFVNPQHLQEVFSQSEDVRQLFDAEPAAKECWALLCMRKDERRQLGIGMDGDAVRKDVMQTAVSFADHQLMSPGSSEADARRALKCCIFNGLLDHIRRSATTAKTRVADLEHRLYALRGRQRHLDRQADSEQQQAALLAEIEGVVLDLAAQDVRLTTIEDHIRFVAEALGNPSAYLGASTIHLHLSRMGIKLADDSSEPGYDLLLSEMRIPSHHEPRVTALVRFPRGELLPRPDFLQKAESFLNL